MEAFENIELPLRDICEELKAMNKLAEKNNETLDRILHSLNDIDSTVRTFIN